MDASNEPEFPMKVVARRTGLSPHVIRVWEKRYAAVVPTRTDTNRRLYSEQDIVRLSLLRRAIAQGQSIGLIARQPLEKLKTLVDAALPAPPPVESSDTMSVELLLDGCERAVERLDRPTLESILGRAARELPVQALLDDVVGPLMDRVGVRWRSGELRPAHEHLATDCVRSFLAMRKAAYAFSASAPLILVTTPAGQVHEIGAMMVSLLACADGWRDIYLGPNLPAEDIAAAVRAGGARALALSIVYPGDDPRIESEFAYLKDQLPNTVRVFVGGRAAGAYTAAIERLGAEQYRTLAEFRIALERFRGA